MNISIVCSDLEHPIWPLLERWALSRRSEHDVVLVANVSELSDGDLLFLISCQEVIGQSVRSRFKSVLIIHASDLPRGRGWSPHVWQILEGHSEITVTLLEASSNVDSGAIWAQRMVHFEGHELYDEINTAVFGAEISLMNEAVDSWGRIRPRAQDTSGLSYYPRRTAEDSKLDPSKSIAEQFNLLRVADPMRYPAFFEFQGHFYEIKIRKFKR